LPIQSCSQSLSPSAATNKKPKVIIVAVMRKMITTLNAMLRDNVAWQPKSA
jgi:transposase